MIEKWWVFPFIAILGISLLAFIPSPSNTLNPNKYIDSYENIFIKASTIDLYFDDTSDKIFLNDKLFVEEKKDAVYLTAPSQFSISSQSTKIVIGTKNRIQKLRVDGISIKISGIAAITSIIIDGIGINIDSDISCENIDMKGTGITVKGLMDCTTAKINGTSVNLNIAMANNKDMDINCTSINATIKYFEDSPYFKDLRVSGLSGAMSLILPKNDFFKVEKNISKNIAVNTFFY
jgi:hypothetical protein